MIPVVGIGNPVRRRDLGGGDRPSAAVVVAMSRAHFQES